jgi:hypothetical protein
LAAGFWVAEFEVVVFGRKNELIVVLVLILLGQV